MQVFEDVFYEEDEHVIVGFINTQYELEYSIYKYNDGGSFPLDDKEYSQQEFTDLLEIELKDFLQRNQSTVTITGHDIRVITNKGILIQKSDLDEEIYEINQSILDGNDRGTIFVKSKDLMCSWYIMN